MGLREPGGRSREHPSRNEALHTRNGGPFFSNRAILYRSGPGNAAADGWKSQWSVCESAARGKSKASGLSDTISATGR